MTNDNQRILRELIKSCEFGKHLNLTQAADLLCCSRRYLQDHLYLFPNAWRLGGTEIRIPMSDIVATQEQNRIHKPSPKEQG